MKRTAIERDNFKLTSKEEDGIKFRHLFGANSPVYQLQAQTESIELKDMSNEHRIRIASNREPWICADIKSGSPLHSSRFFCSFERSFLLASRIA